jgi:hypothetical protein
MFSNLEMTHIGHILKQSYLQQSVKGKSYRDHLTKAMHPIC